MEPSENSSMISRARACACAQGSRVHSLACRSEHLHGTWLCEQICQVGEQLSQPLARWAKSSGGTAFSVSAKNRSSATTNRLQPIHPWSTRRKGDLLLAPRSVGGREFSNIALGARQA